MITKTKAIEATVGEVKKIEATAHEKTVEGIKNAATTAAAGFEQAQVQVKEGMQKAMKTAEQMTAFSQGNVEALMKSSQIFTAGLTEMSKLMAATARANLDETMAAFKALATVKSVKEAVELQTSFARTSMEKAMSESGKITEHSLKLAEQTFAPLTARVNAAVETFS
jgi:phasin family protein